MKFLMLNFTLAQFQNNESDMAQASPMEVDLSQTTKKLNQIQQDIFYSLAILKVQCGVLASVIMPVSFFTNTLCLWSSKYAKLLLCAKCWAKCLICVVIYSSHLFYTLHFMSIIWGNQFTHLYNKYVLYANCLLCVL